jgi:hypothetical protein
MIKILFLAANPEDTDALRLAEEVREIKERLRLADRRDQFVLEQEWAVRVTDLQGHLLRHQPHVVHFSGHGSKAGEIILEDPQAQSKPVTASAMKSLFATLKDNIRCVVLNACYSEAQAKGIAESIECVVGMGRAVNDGSAIAFAASFYQAIGYNRSIREAFDLGTNQIDLSALPGKDVPQLITKPGVEAAGLYLLGHQINTPKKDVDGAPKQGPPSSSSGQSDHYSCFVSYAAEDEEFATKLHARLVAAGVKMWFAPEDMQAGKKLHEQIGEAVQERDRLLLVLSEQSLASEWVVTEIRKARKIELNDGKRKLFPIRLVPFDVIRNWERFDADSGKDLGVEIREYFIPDFSKWKDEDAFDMAFTRLLRDLRADESPGPR